LADVPAPVRTTIEQEGKAGTLREIDRTTIAGKTTCAASIVVNSKEQTTRIAEDGTVIGRAAPKEDDDD
jgi:hypothetical protein